MGKAGEPSELLRTLRAGLGLSQEDMAAAIKTPIRSYQRYESGETKKVPAAVLMRAQALAARKPKK
jgi:cytoskeletal protein RodZ